MPPKEMESAGAILKTELGLTVKIMPVRPLPVKGAYDSGHHAFAAGKLERAVRYAYGEKFPTDGMLFYILLADAINDDGINVLLNNLPDFGMASFSRMPIAATSVVPDRLIAVTTGRQILHNTMRENRYCNNYPCMMAAISSFLRCSELDFKICSECMPIIKQGNIRRALRRMANRNVVNHCSKEEIKNFEEYKKEWK